MKYRQRGYLENQAEALRLAEAFIASRRLSTWVCDYYCNSPEPATESPGFDRRRPVVKWIVWVKPGPPEGGVIDGGDSWLLVDLENQEVSWLDS